MGGRGSYSTTNGGSKQRIRLLGASSGVHARNVGGSPESRSDIVTLVKNAGFIGAAGTDQIGTQSMGAYLMPSRS